MIIPLVSAATISLPLPEHRIDGATALYSLTPASALQINATPDALSAGQYYTLKIFTLGVTSFVVTFGTNFVSTGTLATGVTTAKTFIVTFMSDGQAYNEVCRTIAM